MNIRDICSPFLVWPASLQPQVFRNFPPADVSPGYLLDFREMLLYILKASGYIKSPPDVVLSFYIRGALSMVCFYWFSSFLEGSCSVSVFPVHCYRKVDVTRLSPRHAQKVGTNHTSHTWESLFLHRNGCVIRCRKLLLDPTVGRDH